MLIREEREGAPHCRQHMCAQSPPGMHANCWMVVGWEVEWAGAWQCKANPPVRLQIPSERGEEKEKGSRHAQKPSIKAGQWEEEGRNRPPWRK